MDSSKVDCTHFSSQTDLDNSAIDNWLPPHIVKLASEAFGYVNKDSSCSPILDEAISPEVLFENVRQRMNVLAVAVDFLQSDYVMRFEKLCNFSQLSRRSLL